MFQTAAEIENYATAGKAVITVESEKTGTHFTYQIHQAKNARNRPVFFVSVLTGSNNETDYSYIGVIESQFGNKFRQTAKSRLPADAPAVRGFVWVWAKIVAGELPSGALIRHEGSCGRCGRTLTTPASLDSGIGPECARKIGAAHGRVSKPAASITAAPAAGPAWCQA